MSWRGILAALAWAAADRARRAGAGEPPRPLLVGEANPYGVNPEKALFPLPERASGARLCKIVMGLGVEDYLRRFDRANLCPQDWSAPLARASAERIVDERTGGVVVLLGSKVARTFGGAYDPFTWCVSPGAPPKTTYITLPHPSGLSRAWNDPANIRRARELLNLHGLRVGDQAPQQGEP